MRWLDALVDKLGPHPIQSGRHAYPPSFPPYPYPEQEVMRWLNVLVGKLGPQSTKEQPTCLPCFLLPCPALPFPSP